MSYVQYLEELQYDTQTEWLAVMRQENEDPLTHVFYCEEHHTEFIAPDHCEECPEAEARTFPDFGFVSSEDEPPF